MMHPAPMIGRLWIAGEWQDIGSGEWLSRSPSDPETIIGRFPIATPEQIDRAIATARDAFPSWRRQSRILRAECFDRLARLIERDTDSLAQLMALEIGKPLSECRAEVIEGLHMVQYVFGTGREPIGQIVASEIPEKDAFVRRVPKGVVAVITPWNFPFAVPLWMLGPSLLEGNTVLFKPSESSPAVGQRLVELFLEAGFPGEVLQLLHGADAVGERLVQSPVVQVVLFTGSAAVARTIMQQSAGMSDRIVAAEMGGKNAVIIAADAQLEMAVNAAILSAFKTAGQRCVSASRLIVAESLLARFTERFVATADRLRIGNPLNPQTFYGPLIHAAARDTVLRYNALAESEGAEILRRGGPIQPSDAPHGYFLSPQIYRLDSPKARCLQEEVFGPHVGIVSFREISEAIDLANGTDYGLSLAVITESYRTMRLIREECRFGMGYVNLPCIGAEVHLPFGGVKRSGNGHPSAAGLVDTVTHRIAWTVNHGESIRMAQGLTAEVP